MSVNNQNNKNNNDEHSHMYIMVDPETQIKYIEQISLEEKPNKPISEITAKFCCGSILTILFLIIGFPIAFCDLYFSQLTTENSCLYKYYYNIYINLQTYLLVSGIIELILLIIFICYLWLFLYFEKQADLFAFILIYLSKFSNLFLFAWNIICAIIFWGYSYQSHDCSIYINNYIFASLIIKFASFVIFVINSKN